MTIEMKYFFRLFLLLQVFSAGSIFAQKPTPTPALTGKSYAVEEIKRPATSAAQCPSPIKFTDITARSKINFKHLASPTVLKYLPETMGAGVGLIDYDNDGRLDIYFTNGALIEEKMPKGKMPEKTDAKYWNRLYRQKEDGSFEDVTEKAGVKGEGSRVIVTDAAGKKQIFDAGNAGSYLSANDTRILVGLGEVPTVKSVEIRWTSDKVQGLDKPAIDRYHSVKEK